MKPIINYVTFMYINDEARNNNNNNKYY